MRKKKSWFIEFYQVFSNMKIIYKKFMLQNILKNITKSPWIYQFFDKKWEIIYIGKSRNLFSRVNSYFNWQWNLNFAKKSMVSQVCDIKTILTNTETESLILETTLIKKHKPKYNILMKDDKNHLYIKITNEEIPRILKTRNPSLIKEDEKKDFYFWPYINGNYVNNVLKVLKKVFGYRSCDLKFYDLQPLITKEGVRGRSIPCLDYYIKRCSAPCLLEQEKINSYKAGVENIKNFLKWDVKEVEKSLKEKMQIYAKKLEFEKAGEIKKDLEAITSLNEIQIVRDFVSGDYDVINYVEKFEKIYIWFFKIRDSKIIGFYNYEIENSLEDSIEFLLFNFVETRIAENFEENEKNKIKYILPEISNLKEDRENTNPPAFGIPLIKGDKDYVEMFGKNILSLLEFPKIGWKIELLKLCYKNIYEQAYKKYLASLSTKWFTKQTMKNLLHILGYSRINKDIVFECNDISHIFWHYTVASRTVIENGKLANSKYKKLKIKTLEEWKINDFDSMREVMTRRLLEIEKTGFVPDLIIIDWWKGQLSSVMEKIPHPNPLLIGEGIAQKEIAVSLQIVSIAKREEELFVAKYQPQSLLAKEGSNENSELFSLLTKEGARGWSFEKIVLSKDSAELKLVQKIRDEAHRFAITFNRDSRSKAAKKNILESLPWIWSKTRKKLLKEFGSVDSLKEANREDLVKILTKAQIESLENHGII